MVIRRDRSPAQHCERSPAHQYLNLMHTTLVTLDVRWIKLRWWILCHKSQNHFIVLVYLKWGSYLCVGAKYTVAETRESTAGYLHQNKWLCCTILPLDLCYSLISPVYLLPPTRVHMNVSLSPIFQTSLFSLSPLLHTLFLLMLLPL